MELSWWTGLLALLVIAAAPLPRPAEAETQPVFAQPIGNQEVVASRSAALKCVVENLGDYQVAWIHLERQMILTIHDKVITSIPRFKLVQDDPNTWVLHISQVQRSDGGLYMCQVNTAPLMSQIGSLKVFEPPKIIDDNSTKSEVSVKSRQNVTLTCAATGVPEPTIQWVREDGRPLRAAVVHRGRHSHRGRHRQHGRRDQYSRHDQYGRRDQYGQREQFSRGGESDQNISRLPETIKGDTLHLVHVTPSDMGAYLCMAKNEIPPTVSKRIQLFVEFKPMIWVPNQLMDGVQGSSVTMRCRSEAYPEPIVYWRKMIGKEGHLIIDERKGKYDIEIRHYEYKTEMLLTIHHLNSSDFGSYKCICENYIGKVDGSITLNEILQPTTERVTTEAYRPWKPVTDIVTFRNGVGEQGGLYGDVYLPDQDELGDDLLEEELERERKRYGLREGYNWEQHNRNKEGDKSSSRKVSLQSSLLLAPALLATLTSKL
ncbi:lachesin-like [Amphibalanus amphitrite]|uniref:lachesin-like n=1 Tax=Amphibalanus amphitrite TaxID=1232801 RepID=UPI001C907A55|nr:lachesin-like [Amphibalanus amphitrite]